MKVGEGDAQSTSISGIFRGGFCVLHCSFCFYKRGRYYLPHCLVDPLLYAVRLRALLGSNRNDGAAA